MDKSQRRVEVSVDGDVFYILYTRHVFQQLFKTPHLQFAQFKAFNQRWFQHRIVSVLKVSASDRTSSTLNPLCCVASRRFKPLTPRRLVSSCFLFPEYGGNEHGEIKGTEI